MNTLVAGGALCAALAAGGCSDKEADSGQQVPAVSVSDADTFADSLVILFGQQWGAQQNRIVAELPESMAADFDRKEFMAALRAAVMADTETPGVVDGLYEGSRVASMLDDYDAIGLNINRSVFASSFADGMNGGGDMAGVNLNFLRFRLDSLMTDVQERVMEKRRRDRREQLMLELKMRNDNVEAGKAFAEKLKKSDPSVTETASGLLYKLTAPSDGLRPGPRSKVDVIYSISSTDGTLLDSSRGETVELDLGGSLIDGLKEGVQLMGEGSKAVFYIPSKLGFITTPDGIQPGQMIVVNIELLKVK